MRSYGVRYFTKLENTSLSEMCVANKRLIALQYRERAEIAQSAIISYVERKRDYE